ncbi:TPA: GDP-mannose mannosyl hydrolase [Photobacterium damselae]
MFLSENEFKSVIKNTPLISIDLIIENYRGQILLGQRINKPAQGDWFVPGGRILKDETFSKAFIRLTQSELGLGVKITDADFIGPFEHFYKNNYLGDDFSTHYVTLGYRLKLDIDIKKLPKKQHESYKWFNKPELLNADDVNYHTKLYFLNK